MRLIRRRSGRWLALASLLGWIASPPAHAQGPAVIPAFGDPTAWTCEPPPAGPETAPRSLGEGFRRVHDSCNSPESEGPGDPEEAENPQETSGFFLPVGFADEDGTVPDGTVAVQIWEEGTHPTSGEESWRIPDPDPQTCRGDRLTIRDSDVEHFKGPPLDIQSLSFCCDEIVVLHFWATVAFVPLPLPGLKEIKDDELAAQAYTTAAERRAIQRAVRRRAGLAWSYSYEYDGCHDTPTTSCRKRHCLQRFNSEPGDLGEFEEWSWGSNGRDDPAEWVRVR